MFSKIILILFLLIICVLFSVYLYFRFSNAINVLEINETNDKNRVFVSTSVGLFVGNTVEYQNKDVSVFLGIPYALPPMGSLRFKRPVPTVNSSERFEANRWPNPCLQKDNHLRLNNYNFSEDCLYLNIWSPRVNSTELLPVVFHIHTGAFLFGSASETTYNGIVLSSLADVVVIAFNYRLNLYGFLFTDTEQVSPNVGIYDQVLALEWVSKHINNFGGDPNRVILMGQSTGALSVGLHMLSPLTSNLFNGAIMLSGSPLQHNWLSEPESVKQFWVKYSKEVNCSKNEDTITSNILDCLTKLERNRLPEMIDCKRYSIDPFVVSAPVVFDNHFKLREPNNTLINRNISVLFGYTDDEGSWMLALEDSLKYGPNAIQNLSFNEAIDELKKFIAKIKPNSDNQIEAQSIANFYFNKIPENQRNDTNLLSRTIGIALGDHYIGCSAHLFIDCFIRNNKKSKVYQYYWTYKGYSKSSSFWRTFENVWCGKWMGSCHSFELYSVFGVPFQQTIAFNDIDRQISMKMIRIVSNFAHNKKLSKNDNWMAFHLVDKDIIKPYHRIDYDLDSEEKFGNNLKEYECNSLWNKSLIN